MRATAGNIAADYANGFQDVVSGFLSGRPSWRAYHDSLRNASQPELEELAASRRSESLAFLVLMLTGVCNADCGICFTDRKRKPNELTVPERDDLLAQAAALGAQYVYVPGEGEPTLDKGWWNFLETCGELDLPAVVFTNGMIFGDEDLCRRTWGMTPLEAAKKIADYPVYLYSKYWTPDSRLSARLLNVQERRQPYGQVDGVPVPLGLQTLMEYVPRDRVGIEVCVERRNADDVIQTIVPFAERHGLATLVEMMQHNGRTFQDPSYDMTDLQADAVAPLLSPTSCTLGTCKAVVTVQGYLSPRIAVLENQLPQDRRRVVGADFYRLLHETPYIVERRYNLACLCETIPAELAGEKIDLRSVYNVTPPALANAVGISVDAEPQGGGVAVAAPAKASAGGCGVSGGCASCTALCAQH
ncbi:hypothetical protein [Sphaerisporangium sp. TRM90804]|uniref:hypothetical protein n=1 Tax=Sphaerisporangium sp. TRM90804 TaxID=3031113 RepID=UPI002446DF64|nr:hypothetical protein [Sphaerisporangium sp. TRM90804]MDH2429189.1 hypothetical protein [Sphaerisporangium sp. TRM90804]